MCVMCMLMHAMVHSGHGAPATTAASPPPERESPLDILMRRYALGEINREQLDDMKRVLGITTAAQPVHH